MTRNLLRKGMTFACVLFLFAACHETEEKRISPLGIEDGETTETAYDLDKIQETGELIAVTLSGPDTYYEYRGKGFGLQYELAERFAVSIGTRLRMETAKDTAELFRRLKSGEADLIALEIPHRNTLDGDIQYSGSWSDVCDTSTHTQKQWMVRKSSPDLAEALKRWYSPELRKTLLTAEQERYKTNRSVRRKMRAPIQNRAKGIISAYDSHFIRHSQALGWDWRLMAAQCYQESGFDPQAVSWAGARGLMQIMPETAAHLGLSANHINSPEHNIAAAAQYIRELNRTFNDVSGRMDRINFVLAAYNGGAGHVRDAMALARKHGKNPHKWEEVSYYILQLSRPEFYNDPDVNFGYLRGQETYDYVKSINERWQYYRGAVPGASGGSIPSPSKKNLRNGYKSKVLSAEEQERKSQQEQ